MAIRLIPLNRLSFNPGEALAESEGGKWQHVTISYDITGNRSKIDDRIQKVISDESIHYLQKIECVNTTLYFQKYFGDGDDEGEDLVRIIREELKKILTTIFVDPENLSYETVTAYCTVGNIRAFAFEIDA